LRAAYLNQQPLNEQLPGRSTITTYPTKPRIRRRVRESESGDRREIQNLARDLSAEFLDLSQDISSSGK